MYFPKTAKKEDDDLIRWKDCLGNAFWKEKVFGRVGGGGVWHQKKTDIEQFGSGSFFLQIPDEADANLFIGSANTANSKLFSYRLRIGIYYIVFYCYSGYVEVIGHGRGCSCLTNQ